MRVGTITTFVLLVWLAHPLAAQEQRQVEVISGHVRTDAGAPIRNATLSVTMAPNRVTQQGATDTTGRFSITFANATGDYLVHVAAIGYKAQRKRLTRSASDTALIVDFKLAADVTQLAVVSVKAARLVPDRRSDPARDVGAVDQQREGVFAALSPDQEGNLAAIGNIIPGAYARPEGLSVFGLGGGQSSTTLNGMASGVTSIPRDARATVRVATSTYDPSRGGFSGGQTNVELSPGNSVFLRRAHLTLDAPMLQSTDALSARLGQQSTVGDVSIGSSGPIQGNQYLYNTALQVTSRTVPVASFEAVADDALIVSGVSPDSALRLRQTLAKFGFTTPSRGANTALSRKVAFSARLDRSPFRAGTLVAAPATWNLTVVGNVGEDAIGAGPLSTTTRGGDRRSAAFTTQAVYSRFFGEMLNETRSSLGLTSVTGTPSLSLPGGVVLVSSSLPDGSTGFRGVDLGGNGTLQYDRSNWTWETINESQWYAKGRPHRIKVTAQSRLDGYNQTSNEDVLGQFVFPSLAAFAAGTPSSFTRALNAPERAGGLWSGYLAIGDYWRASPSLQLLYGARIEANRFTTGQASNGAVGRSFDASTTEAPNRVHVSPRMGFTWYPGRAPGGRGIRINSYAIQSLAPEIMVRGGIGEFRNLPSPNLLADASSASGLPGSLARLTCIGDAVPSPQWAQYVNDPGTIPRQCMGGALPSYSDVAPTIRVFDRAFNASRSWRANLTLARTAGPFSLSIDGVYSLNLDQPGTFDLNFSNTPRFALADEAGRPVFVGAVSIVPSTGALSNVGARTDSAFGRVVRYQSDLRSTSRQLTASLAPKQFNRTVYGLAYTLGDVRADARGFDGPTSGSPAVLERTAGNFDIRHQIQASVGTTLPHSMDIAIFARFVSGAPYTPLVNGDVNGDGLINDRAFVFDPAAPSSTASARGMSALLATAPNQARSCLLSQIGAIAARNSCRGPWTAFVNARIGLVNSYGFTKRGFSAALNVSNLLGGFDQLLHGSGKLQGWGASALPDPTLLTVRGFDPAVNRFVYEANPGFGSTRPAWRLARAPFRLTLDFNFDLGVPTAKQQAIKLLAPGRQSRALPRASIDSLVAKLKRQVPDVYAQIMQESDSLLISREQLDALKKAQTAYRLRIDSVWMSTARTLAAMDDEYDENVAMHVLDDGTERGWLTARDELPVLRRILSPLQMTLGPWVLATLQASEGKKSVGIRVFAF